MSQATVQATLELRSESDTEQLGIALAKVLPQRCVLGLSGTLGAGKTRLVQAIAVAAGAERSQVTSPTFTLIHTLATSPRIHHLDAYRLNDDAEFLDLGVEELFEENAWTVIEWAEKFGAILPTDTLWIQFSLEEHRRQVTLSGSCEVWQTRLLRLEAEFAICRGV